ncbi:MULTISPECIES: hypothetical protein [unclassified Cellulophaga]|uniref:hypothetical protein n=1 Tax=unclassified Cellulophaga TaxID=2634405 RepID=UPI0026E2605D|nr:MULTISPECIES: hypothetical protein [unclassified Cellulophaga]MDO6494931.1 hypothetical protein [Cellulophaga sp. 3_MG-2023]
MTTKFNSEIHKNIYRIEVDNYQLVELIEFKNGEFKGSLNHKVFKLNRKEKIKDSVFNKITIPSKMVQSLRFNLNIGGFENLKDCNEIENCISGLDGTTILFQTVKKDFENNAYYWELTSDYYYKQNDVELPNEVVKARRLLSKINEQFDLNKQFQNFLNRLPNGRYLYGMIIMKKGRR